MTEEFIKAKTNSKNTPYFFGSFLSFFFGFLVRFVSYVKILVKYLTGSFTIKKEEINKVLDS